MNFIRTIVIFALGFTGAAWGQMYHCEGPNHSGMVVTVTVKDASDIYLRSFHVIVDHREGKNVSSLATTISGTATRTVAEKYETETLSLDGGWFRLVKRGNGSAQMMWAYLGTEEYDCSI